MWRTYQHSPSLNINVNLLTDDCALHIISKLLRHRIVNWCTLGRRSKRQNEDNFLRVELGMVLDPELI